MTSLKKPPHIVLIGAGSASFGPNTVASIMRSDHLKGCRLTLVDVDEVALNRVHRTAERINQLWDAQMTLCSSTERQEVLGGANFVVVSIEVPPREKLWRLDWEIPLRHGLHQPYGENGGPGGMMHTFRQIPPLMEIVRDMEKHCPDALLINFSNPLPRLTRAITKYSRIQTVGKCHQIGVGYVIVGVLLSRLYGIEIPTGLTTHSDPSNIAIKHEIGRVAREHFVIKAAGLNHFSWMVDVRDRQTGEDLYPLLRKALTEIHAHFEPLSMELFRFFNYCPVPGDTHLSEYLPWTHDPQTKPWERYGLKLYDWDENETLRQDGHHKLARMANGKLALDELRHVHSEGAVEVIEAVSANLNRYEEAVNIPNRGSIPNLPDETIVEVPGIVSGIGVRGLQLDPLPAPIAELCRREAALVELVVDAAVSGDRDLALQALLLDPMINDTQRACRVLDDYFETFAEQLPQFR